MAKNRPRPVQQRPTPITKQDKNRIPLIQDIPDFWKTYWIPCSILLAIAIVLYIQTPSFEFVLDDQIVITDNKFTAKGISGIPEILKTESMTGYFGEQKNLVTGARYRPLSIITFAIGHSIWGQNPAMEHIINFLLYGLTGILLFRILFMMFPSKMNEEENTTILSSWLFQIPFWAALIYLTHPLHSEAVANVKGRDEILVFLFSLLSLYAVLKYAEHYKKLWLVLSGVYLFLALMAKENAITFIAIIPLTLLFFTKASKNQALRWTIPAIIASVFYLLIRTNVIGYLLSPTGEEITDLMNNPFTGMSFSNKMATVFNTLLLYLQKMIYPFPLTHDYYPWAIPSMTWSNWEAILGLVLYVGLIAIGIWGWKRRSITGYAVLFYLATLSIVSNIPFSVGTLMNERFVYISSAAFCIWLAWLILDYLKEKLNPKIGIGILTCIAVVYASTTWGRVPAWKNALSLNAAAIKYSSGSARANCFMGTALFKEYQKLPMGPEAKKVLDSANVYVEKSIAIYPEYYSGHLMYSGIVTELFKYDEDINKLLSRFEIILKKKAYITYIEQYLQYLNTKGIFKKELTNFYYKMGWDFYFQQKKDVGYAQKYISMGLQVDPNNPQLNDALRLVQNAAQNTSPQ